MPWIKIPKAVERKVVLESSADLDSVMNDLQDRKKNISIPAREGGDALVAIFTDGRSASSDVRLYGASDHANVDIDERSFDSETDKVQWVIENLLKKSKSDPDAGQLVFMDTPGYQQVKKGKMTGNIHQEIKSALIAGGMPANQIAIINGSQVTDANTGKETSSGSSAEKKKAVADAYNDGKIKVIVGSTRSMGEGMDLQVTTTDIYHVDIPYTPGEIRQRNGRGVRPGNRNGHIDIHYLMMSGTFDSLSLSIMQKKVGWNQALWSKESLDEISTEEEMLAGSVPSDKQILLELEKDPIKKKKLQIEFEIDGLKNSIDAMRQQRGTLTARAGLKKLAITHAEESLKSRTEKVAGLKPDEEISDLEKRAEVFKSRKDHWIRMREVSRGQISESKEELASLNKQLDEMNDLMAAYADQLDGLQERWFDSNGSMIVTQADIDAESKKNDGDGGMVTQGFSPQSQKGTSKKKSMGLKPMAGNIELPTEAAGGAAPMKGRPAQANDVLNLVRKLWNIPITGKATHPMKKQRAGTR